MNKYKKISQTLLEQKDLLAEQIVRRQYDLQPLLMERYGQAGWALSLRDERYHLQYLAQSVAFNQTPLFVSYIEWARQVLEARGLSTELLIQTMECTREIILSQFGEEGAAEIDRFLQAALQRLHAPPDAAFSQSHISENQPYGKLAAQYLESLLEPNRQKARSLAMNAVQAGAPIKDIYLHVFQPVQHEIGRLWQCNQISVAQEHFASAVTQQIMSQLYEQIFAAPKIGKKMVAACVGDELHEIGIRTVADLFEMDGWDTVYLGANTPAQDIVETVIRHKADLLAASVTILIHLGRLEELIHKIRHSAAKSVKILVGGYPFNVAPALWQSVGADGYAPDGEAALKAAQQLTSP